MSWRSHVGSGRAHAFGRSETVSECGLVREDDCPQAILEADLWCFAGVDGSVLRVPQLLRPCSLCVRALKARTRRALRERKAA